LFGVVFTSVTGVEWALLYAKHHFIRAEASGVLASLTGLAFIVGALPSMGVEAAAWGTVARAGLQMLLLSPGMGRYRAPQWSHPGLRLALRRTAPLTGGQLYFKSDGLLDRLLASLAPAGTLSLYHISQQLYAAASMVLNRAIVAPAVPSLSRLANLDEWASFAAQVRRRLAVLLGVTIAGSAGLALLGRPLLGLVFHHGEFTPAGIRHLWWLLLLLSGVWVGGAMGQILSSSFYAQGDTRTPTRIGVIGFTLAVALKLLAFWRYGIEGLAVAASGYYLLNAAVLLVCLRSRTRRLRSGPMPIEELASL
jgi:putative peptidoglycan lipid II flippase